MKQPAAQLPALQTSPEPQLVPLAALVHIVVLVAGSQLSQPLFAVAPEPWIVPATKQSAAQLPALQTSPAAQLVPFATLLHAVVLLPGWQFKQALVGFAAPDA
jgi:hypothetical protein